MIKIARRFASATVFLTRLRESKRVVRGQEEERAVTEMVSKTESIRVTQRDN